MGGWVGGWVEGHGCYVNDFMCGWDKRGNT